MTGKRAPSNQGKRKKGPLRWLVYLVIVAGYLALMWFIVFPWVDKTFVNQPAL